MTSVVIDRTFSSTFLTAWGDDLQVIVPIEHLLFYLLIIQLDILFRNFFWGWLAASLTWLIALAGCSLLSRDSNPGWED